MIHSLAALLGENISLRYPWALVLLILPFLFFIFKLAQKGSDARQINYPLVHLQLKQGSMRLLLTQWLPAFLYTVVLILAAASEERGGRELRKRWSGEEYGGCQPGYRPRPARI